LGVGDGIAASADKCEDRPPIDPAELRQRLARIFFCGVGVCARQNQTPARRCKPIRMGFALDRGVAVHGRRSSYLRGLHTSPKVSGNGENWSSWPKRSLQHLLRHLRSEVLGKTENLPNREKLLHPSTFQAGQADAAQSFKESPAIVLSGWRHGSAASEWD